MSRFALLLVAFVAMLAVAAAAPVPAGFSLPNIYNAVTDRADGREQAKALVNLVAKEPAVAFGVGGPEAAVEDMWNGEEDAESSASVAQLKMLREVDSLTKLIDQGKKILAVLPRKEARLALLKRKLATILDAKAKREAAEKLDQQQALLDAIKKREEAMASRLNALRGSQSKLESSVTKLREVISPAKPAAAPAAPAAAAAPAAPKAFMEMESESEMEMQELPEYLQYDAAEALFQEEMME